MITLYNCVSYNESKMDKLKANIKSMVESKYTKEGIGIYFPHVCVEKLEDLCKVPETREARCRHWTLF